MPFRIKDSTLCSKENVQSLLRTVHPNAVVQDVAVRKTSLCGDGSASTADRISVEVEWKPDSDVDETITTPLICKTMTLSSFLRFSELKITVLETLIKLLRWLLPGIIGAILVRILFMLISVFQKYFPHAPDAMYETEAEFFQSLRPLLSNKLRLPTSFGTKIDKKANQVVILMSDLSAESARFPNALESLDVETVKSGLRQLAYLHAQGLVDVKLREKITSLNFPTRVHKEKGMFRVFSGPLGENLIRSQVASCPYKFKAIRELTGGMELDHLIKNLWETQEYLDSHGPRTLIHGDAHVGNSVVFNRQFSALTPLEDEFAPSILASPEAGFYDFQLSAFGNPMIDVSYYITSALDPDVRRVREKELIKHYLAALEGEMEDIRRTQKERSVALDDQPLVVIDPSIHSPTFSDAWDWYRLASTWNLVIGWLIVPTVNYGLAVTEANVRRTATAIGDHRPQVVLAELTGVRRK